MTPSLKAAMRRLQVLASLRYLCGARRHESTHYEFILSPKESVLKAYET